MSTPARHFASAACTALIVVLAASDVRAVCAGDAAPDLEVCNGLDDNCNGLIDDESASDSGEAPLCPARPGGAPGQCVVTSVAPIQCAMRCGFGDFPCPQGLVCVAATLSGSDAGVGYYCVRNACGDGGGDCPDGSACSSAGSCEFPSDASAGAPPAKEAGADASRDSSTSDSAAGDAADAKPDTAGDIKARPAETETDGCGCRAARGRSNAALGALGGLLIAALRRSRFRRRRRCSHEEP